jgi:hypothetical protein
MFASNSFYHDFLKQESKETFNQSAYNQLGSRHMSSYSLTNGKNKIFAYPKKSIQALADKQ